MNQVTLLGRLVYEPELKATASGTAYMSNRLAVSRNDKEKTTDFINVQAWTKTAEFIRQYFHKGDPIGISGKIQTRNYEKSDGSKISETYVLINEVYFVPAKKSGDSAPSQSGNSATAPLPFEL